MMQIAQIERLTSDISQFRLIDPEGSPLPEWSAGTHIELILPSGKVRQYSLCGDVDDRESYSIAVLRVEDGMGGSIELHQLHEGQFLGVRAVTNSFPLVHANEYLLLAGGIGITPLYAMTQELATRKAPWSLAYGSRSRRSMVYRDELCSMAAVHGSHVWFVSEDIDGYIDFDRLLDEASDGTAVYCCGPGPMIQAVERLWNQHSQRLSLHVERFSGSNTVSTGQNGAFDLVLASSQETLHVPPDRTALEVVHDVIPDHPYFCMAGECGSCEVRVLAGRVDHRDSILTEEERQCHDRMMLCVSRALTSEISIEL
jgi:ferredoxin-NADP reductase